jgi:formate hydrogenlyase subunit 6/NADH:ubiquinone oxidoreductase subunit I
MNILNLIGANVFAEPVTLRYPQRVPTPEHYRGLVQIELPHCVGCATCAYVCVSSAITVEQHLHDFVWQYNPAKCTFCGRCVEVCPTQALTMQSERPPIYHHPQELIVTQQMDYPLCEECGQPAKLANERVLRRAFDEISDQIRQRIRQCERCRQRHEKEVLLELMRKKEV